MAKLKDILYKVSLRSTVGDTNVEVRDVVFDSRKVQEGSVFVAVAGTQVDGHQYIEQSLRQGAVAIVCQQMPEATQPGITYVEVNDSAEALGVMASNFFGNPSHKMKVVGDRKSVV